MIDINDDLAEVLKTIRRPGDFFAGGAFDLIPPGITVEGVGPLALPVLPEQAALLIAAAEMAPYGRGEKTIVDTSVRRSWQIEPGRVRFSGKRWTETLEGVVARAALGLGVEDRVTAEFYKFLIYDTGGFFVSHRDTEKSPGMFATLVISLPSVATGGEILVRHGGREARLAMTSDDAAEARFAAFYADCVHEVLPVASGRRVTLVYNLKRSGKGGKPVPPNHAREEKQLVERLEA
jgi:predicted 2-oxoglutarate/Fe(II)-dependent dioxygenase YbiX